MIRFAKTRKLNYSLPVTIGNDTVAKTFQCAVCADPASRSLGLMGQELPSGCGCLITFDTMDHHALWMKDCLHPLCALFFDDKGVLIDKQEMNHETQNVAYRPSKPAQFVIEVLPSDAASIKVGDRVHGS